MSNNAFKNYRKGSFRTNVDGVRRAKRVYVCKECEVWHIGKHPSSCTGCGHIDFIHFGSQPEATRYAELRLQENAGLIKSIELQPSFPININGVKICTYRADFAYYKNDERVIEDVKPKDFMTDIAKIKIKMASATHGVIIKIVERG